MCCKSGASYHKSLMRLTGCGTPVDTSHVAFSYKAQHPMHQHQSCGMTHAQLKEKQYFGHRPPACLPSMKSSTSSWVLRVLVSSCSREGRRCLGAGMPVSL